jgi:hypothetical protein
MEYWNTEWQKTFLNLFPIIPSFQYSIVPVLEGFL